MSGKPGRRGQQVLEEGWNLVLSEDKVSNSLFYHFSKELKASQYFKILNLGNGD